MYSIFVAMLVPAALIGANVAIGKYEQMRIHSVAYAQSGAQAQLAQQFIAWAKANNVGGTFLFGGNTGPIATMQRFACLDHEGYPQSAPTFSPTEYRLQPPETNVTEFTVTQTISCPSLLFGTVTATETITVPIP